jgi:hypothetical protein
MSERLQKIVSDAMIKKGVNALSEASDLSVNTIRAIASGEDHKPYRNTVYRLALACGLTDDEALALARESNKLPKKDSEATKAS